eukprot:1156841-Pelagomonas_calceolata.AAC.12
MRGLTSTQQALSWKRGAVWYGMVECWVEGELGTYNSMQGKPSFCDPEDHNLLDFPESMPCFLLCKRKIPWHRHFGHVYTAGSTLLRRRQLQRHTKFVVSVPWWEWAARQSSGGEKEHYLAQLIMDGMKAESLAGTH